MIPDANGVNRDLLKDHRLLTLANVRAHAATYLLNQDRRAQDSRMMYVFLLKLISQEALFLAPCHTVVLGDQMLHLVLDDPS